MLPMSAPSVSPRDVPGRTVAWPAQTDMDALAPDRGVGAWSGAGRAMVSESGAEPVVR